MPILVGSLPKAGIRFGGNTFFKGKLMEQKAAGALPVPDAIVNLMGGMSAGACEAVLAVTPMETVKTKTIQMNCGFFTGMSRIVAESRGASSGAAAVRDSYGKASSVSRS